MKRFLIILFSIVSIGFALLSSAEADDLHPPDYRGDENSIFAKWEIENMGLGLTEFKYNISEYPLTTEENEGKPGFSIESGEKNDLYIFFMPNVVDPLPLKKMRIQVTWSGKAPTIEGITGVDPKEEVSSAFLTHIVDDPLHPDVTSVDATNGYFYEDWELYPNPDYEFITISLFEDSKIHQVVIDSVSTPIPGALWLLGSGLTGLIAFKRKLKR